MKDTFAVNIIHRPEMVPEYAEKITGQGKAEDIGRKALLTESLDIFKFQQKTAHKNGLKTTIQMTYASLFNDEACELARADHEKYGDEIALSLLGLPCKEFREKYRTKDFCIWMFSMEDKKSIVDDVFGKFHDRFGFYPESTGSYYMDADLTNYIKEKYPSVKCAVATCWEEGPKAYHTCNNSWYTLFDGGPWNPWIPSKQNTHAPAADESEDSGIVAIPHLSRDLLACFDGNGSNFGTHPQNVLRGMIYDTKTWEYPYLYNLIDQYRHLAKFNNGYSYNMMFVGPGWLNKMGRWEQPYELLKKSYEDGMAYYGELKRQGKLIDMTMSEFASFYRANRSYTEPECALWKDILYGSDKQLFWYVDPYMRTCINMDQGGAMVDLRPYAAKLKWEVGIGTKHVQDASYPFLIQEKYRAGYFTHYAGEGTIRSAKLSYNGEEVDLCLCRTHAVFSEEDIDGNEETMPDDVRSGSMNPGSGADSEESADIQAVGADVGKRASADPGKHQHPDGSAGVTGEKGTDRVGKRRILTLDPVDIEFADLTVKLQTRVIFEEGSSAVQYERTILEMSNPDAEVTLNEYIVACYGTTEYPEDMTGIELSVTNGTEKRTIDYEYRCREEMLAGGTEARAVIPAIDTVVSLSPCGDVEGAGIDKGCCYIREGYAFSPMFTLGFEKRIHDKEVVSTWLRLGKAS